MQRIPARVFTLLLLLLASAVDRTAQAVEKPDPGDWPNWRGPEQNGISRESGLIDRWDPEGENVLWKNTEISTVSTPIVMHGKVYLLSRDAIETPSEGEKVVCLDANTGKKIWEHKFNVYLTDVPAERVAWSSVVGDPATGRVYAMGVCGYFCCLDGETGKPLWTRSLSEEFGLLSTYGGRTNVPILFEDLVITSAVIIGWGDMARPAHRFLAMDKNTGEVVWFNGTSPLPDDTTYSTPVISVIDGEALMIFGSGDGGLHAFQPRTGKPVWKYNFSRRGINTSPVVVDGIVYCGHSEENMDNTTMGAVAAIQGSLKGLPPEEPPSAPKPAPPGAPPAVKLGRNITQTNTLWLKKEIGIGKCSPVVIDGRVYALDDSGGLYVFNAADGKQIGKKQKLGTMMRASLIYGDGKLYACSVDGRFYVLKPSDKGCDIVHRLRLPQGEEVYGSPIIAHGRIYLPTTAALYCIGDKEAKNSSGDVQQLPAETPVSNDPQPAFVQVVPVEAQVKPGEKVQFEVRLFNSNGQFLKKSKAEFSVDAHGTISPDGEYLADSSAQHTASTVTAQVGDLQGMARVRIIPDLPWSFDISDGEVPLPWVGARYRHIVRELDGDPVMVKVTTIPKGTRSQAWMGRTDLHDYTIQADIRGAMRGDKLPDIGLIAQRYTLDLRGVEQELQIRSWTSQLGRFSKTVPLKWEPDKWYTLKFRAEAQGDKAVLRGKVWERGTPEPQEWQIEATDNAPNLVGSPGLFGNATNAEIFLDNIQVTPN
ncbi:MAG: PQQ-binding-like beta-propeller repeat protein [Pirellulales bacterium]|nr:PQQ-binding-like beta-propeller repeat protein [Pirellulales bacterium]